MPMGLPKSFGHGAGAMGLPKYFGHGAGAMGLPKYFWAWGRGNGAAQKIRGCPKRPQKTPLKKILGEPEGAQKGGNLPPPYGPSTTSTSAHLWGVTGIFWSTRLPIWKSPLPKLGLPTDLGLQRRHRRAKRGG